MDFQSVSTAQKLNVSQYLDPQTSMVMVGARAVMSPAVGAWWWRREGRWVATLELAVPGGALPNVALKHLSQRVRPVLDDQLLTLHTFSFPSGHLTGSTQLHGVLCVWAVAHLYNCAPRVAAVGEAALAIAAVAISRLYLGARFLSDVLGAFAEGLAWLTLSLALMHGRLGAPVRERLLERLGNGPTTQAKENDEQRREDGG